MNTRVLELIKNPKIITETDLGILQSESEKMPYAQSIRALYLYGINLYEPEKYKEKLSRTAVYTTDKKILYQFINSEKNSRKSNVSTTDYKEERIENQTTNQEKTNITESTKPAEPELVAEIESTDNSSSLNKFDIEKIIESEDIKPQEFIVVNGEENRLLYEGEENFLEEKTPEVDLEASKESGQLTLKEEAETIKEEIITDENLSKDSFETPQFFENTEDSIDLNPSETEPEISSKDISFSGIQDFLPEVKFSVPKNHLDYLNPPKKDISQHSDTDKTIPEKERKAAFTETFSEKELEIEDHNAISFETTQAFEIQTDEDKTPKEPEIKVTSEEIKDLKANPESVEYISESEIKNEVTSLEIKPEQSTQEWKPMQFATNIPDALLGKQNEEIKKSEPAAKIPESNVNNSKAIDSTEAKKEIVEEKDLNTDSERPVINVSFFGNEVSKIEEKQEDTKDPIDDKPEQKNESNVGTFINTWQSWLKIDRPKTEEIPVKTKEKIIDNFIESNPKISQLKEESSFVVKEKKDDISHLMTETLAKLYTEQKLYSKAVKAYEILSEKHPEKKDYFLDKIEQIKDLRKP